MLTSHPWSGSRCCFTPDANGRHAFRTSERAIKARGIRNSDKIQTTTVDNTKQQQEQQSAIPFGQLVDQFLSRAASSLKRGPATCLTCKGKGSCMCPMCQGAGVNDSQPRLDSMKHTAQKFKQVLGVDRSYYKTDWQVTNRCLHCHGSGLVLCPDCAGLGVRSPPAKTVHQ